MKYGRFFYYHHIIFLKIRTVPITESVRSEKITFGKNTDQIARPRTGPISFGPIKFGLRTGPKSRTTVPIRTGTVIWSGPIIHVHIK